MKKKGSAPRPAHRGHGSRTGACRSKATTLAAMLALPVLATAQPVFLAIPEEATATISPAVPGGPNPGWRLSVLGDVNGDDVDDIATVQWPNVCSTVPAVGAHVFHGPLSGPYVDADSATQGFDILVPPNTLVTDIAGAGDVNGDGLDDIVVATYRLRSSTTVCGTEITLISELSAAFVIFGKTDHAAVDLSSLSAKAAAPQGFAIEGFQENTTPILSVDTAGDFDGDGFSDVVVGHHIPLTINGAAFVIFGKNDGLPVDASALDGTDGVMVTLPPVGTYSFVDVAGGGDVDGDGLDDIVVRQTAGFVCCCCAAPSPLHVIFGTNSEAPVIAAPPADGDGFTIMALDSWVFGSVYFGTPFDLVGDMDGDGLDDIVVGSTGFYGCTCSHPNVHVVFGKGSNSMVDLTVPPSPGKVGKRGKQAIDEFAVVPATEGWSSTGVGDVDGDGLSDILVRPPFAGSVGVLPGKPGRADFDTGSVLFVVESASPIVVVEGGNGIGLFSQFAGGAKLAVSGGLVSVVDFAGLITPPPTEGCPVGGGFTDSPDGRVCDDASGAHRDDFGRSVAVCGDTAAIGVPLADPNGLSSGEVHVVDYDGSSTWTLGQVLVSPTGAAGDSFGSAVAINGDVLVVGEPFDDTRGLNAGAAHVYRRGGRKGLGTTWTLEATIYGSDAGTSDRFGSSVAVSGDRIVVGAPFDVPSPRVGAAYVFEYTGGTKGAKGAPLWIETDKLTPSDGYSGDAFSTSVAIDGDIIAVGSPGDDDNGSGSGSLYVFTLSGGTWVEAKGTAPDGQGGDSLGTGVDVFGTAVVAGAPGEDDGAGNSGAVYLFSSLSSTVINPSGRAKASSPWPAALMGSSVAIGPQALRAKGPVIGSGYTVVAGAPYDDQGGTDAGATHVFAMGGVVKGLGAIQLEKYIATVPDSVDYNGSSVDITGFTALSGAPWGNRQGSGAQEPGTAYFFTPFSGPPTR